jgi:predicted Zn-dependent peptidase
LHRDLPTAIDIISELATKAKIPAGEVKKERHVVAEEIKDAYDTPHEWVHEVFTGQIWPDHPLGRPIAGDIPTVMGMTRAHLQKHIRRFYRPEHIVVAAGGNLSHDRLVRMVRQSFEFESKPMPRPEPTTPNGTAARRAVTERDISQTHVCLGFPTWRFADKRRHTTLIASNILGGGMSSRLFQTVREKRGLVYAIYTFHDAFHDTGFFGVYFACDPKQVVNASNLVLRELGRLVRTPVPASELADIKSQLRGNLLMGLESTPPRTHRLARHELYLGGYVTPGETWKCINRVTSSDLTGFARDAFSPDRLAVSILGPVKRSILGKLDLDLLRPRRRRTPTG